jgi:hypothetical protein
VARGAELTELARLPDLAQYMLEEIALAVGVGVFQAQFVDQGHVREIGDAYGMGFMAQARLAIDEPTVLTRRAPR